MLFSKTTNKKYAVGFDLSDTACQVSYSEQGAEPVTFSVSPDNEDFDIPMTLTKKLGANIWYCGREAEARADRGDGTKIRHLLSAAALGKPVLIEDEEYDPSSLLALYVRRVLALIEPQVPTEAISVLTFTLDTLDRPTIAALGKVRDFLALPFDDLCWENHQNSFFSYMLQQSDSMHEKDVLLCEYDGVNAMKLNRLCYNPGTTPIAVYVKTRRADEMGQGLLDPRKRDETFLSILKEEVPDGEISTIFLIGAGFSGDRWMKESLKYAAYHRRVFLGNNLYSKGAAYSAMLRRDHCDVQDKYFFLGENCIVYNLGLMVLRSGRNIYYPLLDAGANWYEVEVSREFIVEGAKEAHIILTPLTGGAIREEVMSFDGLPDREERTTRVRLTFTMKDVHTMLVHAEDVGFGEIAPSSGRTWDHVIENL
jgi:hypothetical protein